MKGQNSYKIVWYKNEKYGEPITRETWVFTSGGRASAINIFMANCGNVKKNTIERAEEYTTSGMVFFTPKVIKQNGRWMAVEA